MALIAMRDVTIAFEDTVAVDHVSFEVDPGDYLVIVGENGSGKSTLMRAMLGLVRPSAGKITYGDGLSQNRIGYLPQQTAAQRDFPASVEEVVLSGCVNRMGGRCFFGKAEREKARANMALLDVERFRKKSYRNLSGGQQQRVLLARALCATRKLLLLDEPVSGLDPKATADLYALIEDLNRGGLTVVMISHDIAAAVRYASHILHIGGEVFFGTKEEYCESGAGRFFMERAKGGEADA